MPIDEELLDAWRGGDKKAGSALFHRHFEPLRRFFANKVGRDTEDLVQQTFAACVDASTRFAGRSSFRTFLFAIAHNILRAYFRKRRPQEPLGDRSIEELGAGPSTIVAARREQRTLLRALRELPLSFQVVLELYYWEQLSGRELGEILEIPEDTARSRLRRGKQLLLEAMVRLQEGPPAETTDDDLERWAGEVRAHLVG